MGAAARSVRYDPTNADRPGLVAAICGMAFQTSSSTYGKPGIVIHRSRDEILSICILQ